MEKFSVLLGAVLLTLCFTGSHSQTVMTTISSNAKTCSDCNGTASSDCTQETGYVKCSCKQGYVGDGFNCTPIVFCNSLNCCPQGYSWNSALMGCVDINECSSMTLNNCPTLSACANKNGIYLCSTSRTLRCPTSACDPDKDCMNINNVPICADPCTNYAWLDGTSRLFTINSTRRFSTDRFYFGWFRYTNNFIMKEGCVGSLKCGSLEPFTLGGTLPTNTSAVVMVPLIINYLTGCSSGTQIPVKACPGGFYVYKFSGTLRTDVYCTVR
eukprot:XP_017947300.1 PREDICTED: uromodulin-like [Xenopus tropicalis]